MSFITAQNIEMAIIKQTNSRKSTNPKKNYTLQFMVF